MSKIVRLPRWARWLTRIVFTPVGIIIGYVAADSLLVRYSLADPADPLFSLWCTLGALIGGAVLLFIGPFFCRLVYAWVKRDTASYRKFAPSEIVSAFIGLTLGLLIAFLITHLYSYIPDGYRLLVISLSIVTYVTLGVTGLILGHVYLSQILAPNTTTTVLTPKVLDSSILIDGRIVEIAETGFVSGPFVIPNFVLTEIKGVADSSDPLKRNRGRRGLDIIKALQSNKEYAVVIDESVWEGDNETKLIALAKELRGEIVTVNYNLAKVAGVKEVKTLNLNDLANAIKPVALPGEKLTVDVIKQGKDKTQGLAYLPDGTMIVVENGDEFIGKTVEVTVSTSIQTNTGRIIFAKVLE